MPSFYVSPLVETELLYIICRTHGFDYARVAVTELLQDFIVESEETLKDDAARLKCRYAISLAGCYSVAVAILRKAALHQEGNRNRASNDR